jgi:predicted secreted protein
LWIAGVGKLVEVDHPATAMLQQVNDQIGADKSCSSGYKNYAGFVSHAI